MGNCWPSLVNDQIPSVTKPSNPDNILEECKSNNDNSAKDGASGAGSGSVAVQDVPTSGQIITPNLKMFSYAKLKLATRNFRPDTVLGEGGFGRVFKGWVDPKTYAPSKVGIGMAIAVKKSDNPDSAQGLRQWQSEVKFLGKFSHPNLVKLLGYCWEERQFLLVYEYMEKGSLESHLFRLSAEPLPWDTRLKIAIGAAQGLTFLHTTEKQVIYRDFKSSNILLDRDFNAKLSDFGLAKTGPVNGYSHVTTSVIGTFGYTAPEYVATGHLYVNSDVYGFGVVLLEILTGRRVLDMNRPTGEHNLLDWAMPCLPDKRKLKKIMDPRLKDQFPPKSAFQAAELVLKCLKPEPKNRPSMEEVLVALQQINAIKMASKESKANSKHNSLARSPFHQKFDGNGAVVGGRPRMPLPRPR
ncbi:Serine/threonine-protein kinase [Actinidia chinensis var. chinensis]|uniref:non-specific serine/threonine protein kinase n=1 Tax=Actinidia chinensis var. chinensis TaxID=1590841 RepID=A0A2R6QXR3_ACTCC|nr:Serine/threonine-protein kinase [Actinidia chinensis var. chinensis]